MKRTQKSSKYHVHITLVTIVVVIVLVAAAGLFTYAHVRNQRKVINDSSADAVAGLFNSAMANGDKNEVAALESGSFKKQLQQETTNETQTKGEHGAVVTDNYYDVAKSDGDLNLHFGVPELSGAKVTFSTYIAADGTTGVSALFSEASVLNNKLTFSPSFALNLIPNGNTWSVDGVMPYATATQ